MVRFFCVSVDGKFRHKLLLRAVTKQQFLKISVLDITTHQAQAIVACCDKATVPQNICSQHNNTSDTEQKSVGYMMTLRVADSRNIKTRMC